jgi:dihydroorotase
VLFDVGHGQGSFGWTVAEICAQYNFYPDTISTDLHTGNHVGPAYDLPTVMSKFLHLGMPLTEVIRAVTSTPAKAIGWESKIGSLTPGKEADVTVLKLVEGPIELEDCQSQVCNLLIKKIDAVLHVHQLLDSKFCKYLFNILGSSS